VHPSQFCQIGFVSSRPPAGNANRWLAPLGSDLLLQKL